MSEVSIKAAARVACAAAASVLVWGASAQAADLGGNCCADLEERIAELEATTARKGNRKVSLAISGWVNEGVFFWDDGTESNVYVGTNSLEQSRFKFSGEAKIDSDWAAGYTIEVGIAGAPSSSFKQNGVGGSTFTIRKSNWFVKSKTLGKLTVGLEGTATYHLLDDADGANTRNYSDAEAAAVGLGAFGVRVNGGPVQAAWTSYMGGFNNRTPGQSGRRNIVRYDTPTFAGFSATAAWGEDDMWDMALNYKGEVGDFKLVARAGYGESTDPISNAQNCTQTSIKVGNCQWWGAAGTIMHAPTGLYVYGGFGQNEIEFFPGNPGLDDNSTMWFVQAGIEKKFVPLGKTTIFGEYRNDDVGFTGTAFTGVNGAGTAIGSDFDFYALGVVQNIEAAAMDLYLIYRHNEGDITSNAGGTIATTGVDDLDMVITGARIQF